MDLGLSLGIEFFLISAFIGTYEDSLEYDIVNIGTSPLELLIFPSSSLHPEEQETTIYIEPTNFYLLLCIKSVRKVLCSFLCD